jgi:hypothetical protein
MRTIKFRAWDKESKKMFFMNGITGSFFAFDGEDSLKLHPEVPIMQFTGLKDKNGKEIYEGDIVARESIADLPYKVEWFGTGWFYSDGDMLDEHDSPEIEVIGNIYENPEELSSLKKGAKGR